MINSGKFNKHIKIIKMYLNFIKFIKVWLIGRNVFENFRLF